MKTANSAAASDVIPRFDETPRILIIDDHELLGEGLVYAFRAEGIEAEVATGPSLDAIRRRAAEFGPDIVLLDLHLGEQIGTGLDLVESLCDNGSIVLMLTGVRDHRVLAECVEAGAAGIVGKSATFDELMAAIRTARDGTLLSVEERHAMLADLRSRREQDRRQHEPFERLTPREQDVLAALTEGDSASTIAERSFVSIATVRTQIRSILVKLGVQSQLAAVARARQAGWSH